MSGPLLVERRGDVLELTLHRPEALNAFTVDMHRALADALRDAADPAIRAVILTGAGRAFCGGQDLEEATAPDSKGPGHRLGTYLNPNLLALRALDKPVIAAVNGAAVGAGMDMSLMCDMRFAARSARFSEGYVRVGLVPGDGGAYFLPRLVGTAKALELLLTGDFVDAGEAHRVGIVNRVYEDEELAEETRRFAERLAAGPPLVTRMIKRTVYQSVRSDLRTSLDLVSSHMAIAQSTEDSKEALSAFLEKREPKFRGR